MSIVDTIDWNTVGVCNLRCLHCYGPSKKLRALPHDQLVAITERIKRLDVKRVVLTGGEPLLTPRIKDILQKLYEFDIEIALSTNGSFVENYWDAISDFVSSLNIPIDGHTSEIHALSRMDTSTFYTNMAILKRYQEFPTRRPRKLRIGTVYSKATVGYLRAIAELLLPYADCITTWKIYELIDHESQQELRAQIMHDANDFVREISEIKNLTELQPITSKIMVAPSGSRDCAYFMLNPLAQVVVPTRIGKITVEKVIGHFLEDPLDELVRRWQIVVNMNNYRTNHHEHYEKG